MEAHDEWKISERRYLPEGSMALPAAKTSTSHGIVGTTR